MEELSRFSNYYDNTTTLHPLATGMLIVAVILVFVVPRRYVFLPMILLTVFVPASQRVVIATLDFHFLRLVILAGWLRVLARGEARPLELTKLDWMMIAWSIARLVAVVVRRGSVGALVNQLGHGFDALGIYLLARILIRNWSEFDAVVKSAIWASLPVFAFSTYEVISHHNPFHIFGQVGADAIVRDGRVRARGAFSHQILAGVYWAALLPLMVGRFLDGRDRILTGLGIFCSIGLIVNCASSTPLLGAAIAMVGGAFWVLRKQMRLVRWGIVLALVLIQLAMAKPIWHLFHRVGAIGLGSSTGYHRYRLFEAFVNHFKQWALVGVNGTGSWGRQLEDVTNHFISQGVKGGLLTFVLFIAVYVYAFSQTGTIIHAAERRRTMSYYTWSLGVCLLGHVAMMNATSYFGQILLPWYLVFAAVASVSVSMRATRRRARSPIRAAQPATPYQDLPEPARTSTPADASSATSSSQDASPRRGRFADLLTR